MSRPDSLREYVDSIISGALDRCTACGKCYEVCPMPIYSQALEGAQPNEVMGQVLSILRRETGHARGLEFVKICTQSSSCISACPEGVNPMLMLRAARMIALGSLGDTRQMEGREEPQFFRKIDSYAALQLSDQELVGWHDRRLP